ncbi:MAG: BCCT family transporter [Proteobacteria bacterium]|nr:BCCT family transporter [Pseudomonadota bacterium]
MQDPPRQEPVKNIDWFIFGTGSAILTAFVLTIIATPESSAAAINSLYEFVTTRIGVIYVVTAILVFGFLLWLALSQYGNVVLGDRLQPEHSTYSWASMLFCAGIGASCNNWI